MLLVKILKSIGKVLLIFSTVFLLATVFLVPKTAVENCANLEVKKVYDLTVDGQTYQLFTAKTLTKDILTEKQIVLGPEDKVFPALDEVVEDEIRIVRVTRQTVEEEKSIPYEQERRESADLFQGETRVIQKGQPGKVKKIYEVVLEDGQEKVRNLVKNVIVKEPVKQIVAYGTLQTVSRDGSTLNFKKALTMTATAYTHTGNRTATGTWPSVGTVAVDPKVIPLHSRLYVDGYGYATAKDVGSSIKGNKIDLFFETKAEALKWGRRQVQVYLLE